MSTSTLKDAIVGQSQPPANPFARSGFPTHVSAGAVAIEQERAIAEAQGKLVIAKRFPRNPAAAFQAVMESCSRPGFAEEALYSYPRGGETVSGPSIRMAEELARCWGNIDYGLRELSRREGESEMDAYAWDLETNTVSSQKFTVRHLRDKRGGAQKLTDERDIYEIGASMGARRMRARILAILPGDLVEAAVEKCRATLRGESEVPLADRVRQLVAAFAKLDVPATLIEKRIKKPASEITGEDLADLRGIYKSLRDGMTKPSDWFGGTTGVSALAAAAAGAETADRPPQPASDNPDFPLEDRDPPPGDE
jgi:hypothetical protein